MRRLLVLRPEPGASATIGRAAALGLVADACPLFRPRAIDWVPPDPAGYDAIMVTSAAAVRLGGAALARYAALPAYAVGAATAAALAAARFATVRVGQTDAAVLLARAADEGIARMLHTAAREHRPVEHPAIRLDRVVVYAMDAVARLPEDAATALMEGAVALLHSPRAGAVFAELVAAAGLPRADLRLAAISAAAADAAGAGWAARAVAARPTDDALLAAAVMLCEEGA